MKKRLVALFMIMSMVLCGVFSQVGYSAGKDFSFDKYNEETEFNFIKISRPELDEKVYKKNTKSDYSFVVSGYTDLDDLRISISLYNDDSKKYETVKFDDKDSFDTGKSGVLLQEIKLPYKDDNAVFNESKIPYKKYDILVKALRLSSWRKDSKEIKIQVKKFTINVIDESQKDKNVYSVDSILESVDRTLKINPSPSPTATPAPRLNSSPSPSPKN